MSSPLEVSLRQRDQPALLVSPEKSGGAELCVEPSGEKVWMVPHGVVAWGLSSYCLAVGVVTAGHMSALQLTPRSQTPSAPHTPVRHARGGT